MALAQPDHVQKFDHALLLRGPSSHEAVNCERLSDDFANRLTRIE